VQVFADKLTQCAMMLCVAMRYPAMWWLLGLHVVKETVMLIMGWFGAYLPADISFHRGVRHVLTTSNSYYLYIL